MIPLAFACTFAGLYSSSVHAPLYLDDFWGCRHIPRLGRGALALLSPSFGFFYRPTLLLYFSALRTLLGWPSSVLFHTASLLLHASVCALLCKLAYRLTRDRSVAVLAAALFLLFPPNWEPVTWISAASTLLAGLLYLASLHCWLSYREMGRTAYGIAALILGTLAFGSKEGAISLPAVLLAIDLWTRQACRARLAGRFWRRWR